MRDFEEDFEFDWEEGLACGDKNGMRIDDKQFENKNYKQTKVSNIPENEDIIREREARIKTHQKRVQQELRKLVLI